MRPVYQRICHQSLALDPRLETRKAKTNAKVHIVWVGLREGNESYAAMWREKTELKRITHQTVVVNSPVVAKPDKG